jgi:hypothetical protein
VRQQARGIGGKARLPTIEAQLSYILRYFRCYPTFDLARILFDFDHVSGGGTDNGRSIRTLILSVSATTGFLIRGIASDHVRLLPRAKFAI